MRALCCLPLLGLLGGIAYADMESVQPVTLAANGRANVLEEITVTAQRREQRAQSIPLALSAFTGADLALRQIDAVTTLQHSAPNLQVMPAQGNARTATIAMRGQVSGDIVATVDPAVGLFLDGVYIARVTGANLDLVDIERVEIMRGSQGTNYGRNTIGGAINIVPNRPQKTFDAFARLLAGNHGQVATTGMVNAPLFDHDAAVRLVAQHAEHDGFAHTALLDRELSDDNTDFVRAQLQIGPDDRWYLNLALDYSNTSTANQWITLLAAAAPATLLPAAAGHPEDSLQNYVDPFATTTSASHAGSFDSRAVGTTATTAVPLHTGTLKMIVARRELDLRILQTDLDGTPYDLATQFYHGQEQWQNSVELHWFGTSVDERLDWIGGWYYFDEYATTVTHANSLYPLNPFETSGRTDVRNDSRSAWLQVTTALSPQWSIEAGARYVVDRRQLTSEPVRTQGSVVLCNLDPEIMDAAGRCRATFPARSFHFMPFDVAISYAAFDESMFYAKYSRGFRSGGYNARASNALAAQTFGPEQLDSIELGWKSDLLAHSVRLNIAVFDSDYDDIQLTRVIQDENQIPVVVNINAGEATIQGGELELQALLPRGQLSLAIGRTQARYTRLETGVIGVSEESEFANIPAWTASIAFDVPFRLGTTVLNLHGDYARRDDVYFGGDAVARQAAFGIANLMIATKPGNWEFAVWCRNVTDTRYLTRAISTGAGFTRALPADPRTCGATATWHMSGRQPRTDR